LGGITIHSCLGAILDEDIEKVRLLASAEDLWTARDSMIWQVRKAKRELWCLAYGGVDAKRDIGQRKNSLGLPQWEGT